MSKSSILVLGSASWIGSRYMDRLDPNKYNISGTYFNTIINYDNKVNLFKAKHLKDYKTILRENDFDIIINFLRGENQEGLEIHEEIINYCKSTSFNYIYCSSALALDAYNYEEDLTEDKLAYSESEYGAYKANCEKMLYDSGIDWCILRFSSLQGYCKHKIVRNENLLKQLRAGNIINVDQKVIQNRMYADDAVDLMLEITNQKLNGIIHLGTTDASDEIDFLKKHALTFGYDKDLIKANEKIRNVNLNCIPSRVHQMCPGSKYFTEKDTLSKISKIEAYQNYINVS